jgi:hypothetical protein
MGIPSKDLENIILKEINEYLLLWKLKLTIVF